MKVAKLIGVVSLIAASTLAGTALAHEHKAERHDGARHAPHMQFKRMLAGLDLSEAQQLQIKQLLKAHRQDMKAAKPDRQNRQALQQLLIEAEFDEAAVRQILQQQQAQQLEQQMGMLKLKHQVLQVLTEAQREQLKAKQQRWQEKMQQRQTGE